MHGKVALAKPFSERRLHLSLQVGRASGLQRWLWEGPCIANKRAAEQCPWRVFLDGSECFGSPSRVSRVQTGQGVTFGQTDKEPPDGEHSDTLQWPPVVRLR